VIPAGLSPAEIDAEVKRLVGCGEPLYRLKAEVLEAVRPDLIVAQDVCAVCAVSYDDVLAIAARLPGEPRVLRQDPTSLAEVLENALEVAEAAGLPEAGTTLKAEMESRIERVRAAVAGRERPPVLALEWLDPPFTGGHWVPEMIEIAGGHDLIGRPGLKSAEHDWSELEGLDPDLAVVMPCGYDADQAAAQAREYIDRIKSTGAERIVAVDAAASFSRPGPRLINGIELLATLIHPGAVEVESTLPHREVMSGKGPARRS
jgi:iron complex transport system substrate-binding protein